MLLSIFLSSSTSFGDDDVLFFSGTHSSLATIFPEVAETGPGAAAKG